MARFSRWLIIWDIWRLAWTQRFSDCVHALTNRDCFEQRNWCYRLYGLITLTGLTDLPKSLLAIPLAVLYGLTAGWFLIADTPHLDRWRRANPEYMNPERVLLTSLMFRTLVTVAPIWLLFGALLSRERIVFIVAAQQFAMSIALHLDACNPQQPRPPRLRRLWFLAPQPDV